MKLAIVHDWLTGMRGGEKCLKRSAAGSPAQLFTLLHVPGSTSPAIERMQISTSFLQRVPGAGRHYRYLLPLMPTAVERFKLPEDLDLVVSFSHAVAKSVVPPPGVPHVCYCFTPMRYAWHLREEYFSDGVLQGRVQGTVAAAQDLVLDRLQAWDRETAQRVTHFIASSRNVAERISQCYGRESTIVHPPVDTDFYTCDDSPREDFYLCVSAMAAYKRIELAIAACNRLRRRLVIIGQGPQQRRLESLAGPTVTLLGWRSDEEIRNHLRRCRALLFPGQEDFGIVPLEAQACGAPVVAPCSGAMETILSATSNQNGTGVLFDEPTVESLAGAMLWLEDNLDRISRDLARQQAERFNKHRYESELMTRLQQIVVR